jgi:methylated-DNA-[protein]-cysteine S-methyltransferase
MMNFIEYLDSPVGLLELKASANGLRSVSFVDNVDKPVNSNKITNDCAQQIKEYFNLTRKTFDVPFDIEGTPFQKSVWKALLNIPYGKSASYQDIANEINNPKAVRAVGLANGKNPISIITPCHRVIGKNKSLTGYAGGLDKKKWLLNHEGIEYID